VIPRTEKTELELQLTDPSNLKIGIFTMSHENKRATYAPVWLARVVFEFVSFFNMLFRLSTNNTVVLRQFFFETIKWRGNDFNDLPVRFELFLAQNWRVSGAHYRNKPLISTLRQLFVMMCVQNPRKPAENKAAPVAPVVPLLRRGSGSGALRRAHSTFTYGRSVGARKSGAGYAGSQHLTPEMKRVLEEVRADPVFQERSRRGPRHVYRRAVAALEALMPKLGVEDGDEPEGAEK
jgi:hypothetical protein